MSASPEDAIVGAAWAALHDDPTVFDAAMFLAALRAAGYVVERDWQDISTAPRDGTWIITYGADTPISDGFVLDYWPCDEDAWNGNPTHWRPLPAPPT